jgi:hypothetical protein
MKKSSGFILILYWLINCKVHSQPERPINDIIDPINPPPDFTKEPRVIPP